MTPASCSTSLNILDCWLYWNQFWEAGMAPQHRRKCIFLSEPDFRTVCDRLHRFQLDTQQGCRCTFANKRQGVPSVHCQLQSCIRKRTNLRRHWDVLRFNSVCSTVVVVDENAFGLVLISWQTDTISVCRIMFLVWSATGFCTSDPAALDSLNTTYLRHVCVGGLTSKFAILNVGGFLSRP